MFFKLNLFPPVLWGINQTTSYLNGVFNFFLTSIILFSVLMDYLEVFLIEFMRTLDRVFQKLRKVWPTYTSIDERWKIRCSVEIELNTLEGEKNFVMVQGSLAKNLYDAMEGAMKATLRRLTSFHKLYILDVKFEACLVLRDRLAEK